MGKEVSTGESEWIVGWPVVDWRGGNEGNEGKTACVHQQLYNVCFLPIELDQFDFAGGFTVLEVGSSFGGPRGGHRARRH